MNAACQFTQGPNIVETNRNWPVGLANSIVTVTKGLLVQSRAEHQSN